MRVLHVIPSVSNRSGGPAEAIFPMCRALQTRGLEVAITTTSDGMSDAVARPSGSGSCVQTYRGVSTHFFPVQWGDGFKYSRPLSVWLDANVENFDVVHIHAVFNHPSVAAAKACRKHGIPYLIRPLGTLDPWSMKQKPLRKKLFWTIVGKKMLKEASFIHYTARGELESVEEAFGLRKGMVVPLGIETFTDEALGTVSRDDSYVLVLSRLHAKKGLDVLIQAFLQLKRRQEFSNWRLVIAGDGDAEYTESLKRLAVGSEESIVFRGWLEGQEKSTVLRNASLLALPSRQENFGLCVLEALSRGVPVLVSAEVNLADAIHAAGAGWVSRVEVLSIMESLAQALSNRDERIKRGAAGLIFSRDFEWSRIAEKLENVYAAAASVRET